MAELFSTLRHYSKPPACQATYRVLDTAWCTTRVLGVVDDCSPMPHIEVVRDYGYGD
jgi:hypothetical protein